MQRFKTIAAYCEAISISPPKHPHFDIRSFEENMQSVVHKMKPFRHAFYAIAIKVEGRGKAISGHHQDFPEGSLIFFNSPFQILSWDILPDWQGFYVMFSQDFIAKSKRFVHMLDDFPFLKIDKAIPFNIPSKELPNLLDIYEKIRQEYQGNARDKFDFIETYVFLLLLHVKRLYHTQVGGQEQIDHIRKADVTLLSRFQQFIQQSFYPDQAALVGNLIHSPSYYAEQLHIHPNHLNAIVKQITGHTALQHIHSYILQLAKSQLAQTSASVKEIAFSLQFDSPNNFSTFFKKHCNQTPLQYRKSINL
ncbi:MAG: helix-turn-helix domain-containing protein [Bacteroidota bacterium]